MNKMQKKGVAPPLVELGGFSTKTDYPGQTFFQKTQGGKGVSGLSGIAPVVKGTFGNFLTGIR